MYEIFGKIVVFTIVPLSLLSIVFFIMFNWPWSVFENITSYIKYRKSFHRWMEHKGSIKVDSQLDVKKLIEDLEKKKGKNVALYIELSHSRDTFIIAARDADSDDEQHLGGFAVGISK